VKVFISHARQDDELAGRIRNALIDAGLTVRQPDDEIYPGDNWAQKIGRALEQSEIMVAIVSQDTLTSGPLKNDLQYALTSKNYGRRVLPVFVGFTTFQPGPDVPWLLLRLQPVYLESATSDPHEVVERVRSLISEPARNAG
jgi:TIR domain